MITNIIIEKLEEGVIPWQMPWTIDDIPRNLISNKPYRGINMMLLYHHSQFFNSPFFLTFKQIQQLNGKIIKGSKSFPIVFWKLKKYQDSQTEEKFTIPILKYYRVFNLSQVEGINPDKIPEIETNTHEFTPIEKAEQLVEFWVDSPNIKLGEPKAYYSPGFDYIGMPDQKYFHSDEEYYSTLFHELIHSTGHKSRLNRFTKNHNHTFGSDDYSKEELIAEIGSSFLCGVCDISHRTIDNSAAYINGWLRKLKNDKKLIIQASGKAQKAADYIRLNY